MKRARQAPMLRFQWGRATASGLRFSKKRPGPLERKRQGVRNDAVVARIISDVGGGFAPSLRP